jgi:hypothetical protein
MKCDLCGSTESIATYGVYSPMPLRPSIPNEEYERGNVLVGSSGERWLIKPEQLWSQCYCDACVEAARKKSVRHAAFVFFLPTVGMMRLWKFSRCTKQEMGDLMAASVCAHKRDPREKHILWPLGAEGYASLESYLTREGAEKRLCKQQKRTTPARESTLSA